MSHEKYLLICIYCLFIIAGNAQESPQDSLLRQQQTEKELKKQKKAARNFHYNILGGPSYTPDFGLLIGGSALMTFRMNPKDTTMRRSVIPASVAFMFNGGLNLVVKPQLFFKNDRFRIFGQLHSRIPRKTSMGWDTIPTRTMYEAIRPASIATAAYRLTRGSFSVWEKVTSLQVHRLTLPMTTLWIRPSTWWNSPTTNVQGGTADGYKDFSSGVGFLLTYDTRDVPANPYKGLYFDLRGLIYQKFLGSYSNFSHLELDYRQYKSVGKRKVVAWTVQSKHSFGHNLPLNKYVLSGTPFDLRGYYMGQYRDKSSHVALAEYRQMFNTDQSNWIKRVINRLGFVAWGGCGFMGPTPGKIEGVLPNAGLGLSHRSTAPHECPPGFRTRFHQQAESVLFQHDRSFLKNTLGIYFLSPKRISKSFYI